MILIVSTMIPLYVNNGVAYVWNSEDWHTIRLNRICGGLVGTLVSFPRQNDFQGLPMALLSEEAAFLVEKGLCELIELPRLNDDIPEKQKQKIKEIDDKVLLEQYEALKNKKIYQMTQKIDIIAAGKKKKMMSQGNFNCDIDREAILQEEINKIKTVAPNNVLLHLPTEHLVETECKKLKITDLSPSVLYGEGATRYAIFKDLWEKGYHLTSGSKFGADFLVYPGDPVRFHAMYMLRCVNDIKECFRPTNLVAFGRLSVSVNKLAVFGFWNSFGKVEYQTLEWHE